MNDFKIGQQFAYLKVLEKDEFKKYYYRCQCECGVIKSIRKDGLVSGSTKSCGCKKIELHRKTQLLPINESFFQTDSPELSYFLGFFLADGYVSKNKQIGIQLQERDLHILETFSYLIYGRIHLQYINKDKKYCNIKGHNQYRLVFSNDIVFQILTDLGFDNHKSTSAIIPEHLKDDIHFWRGVIDGDGCMCITRKQFLLDLVGTPSVVQGFKDFCNRLGLELYRDLLFPKKGKYSIDIRTFRLQGIKALKLCEVLYTNKKDIYLYRKYNKYQEYLKIKDQ